MDRISLRILLFSVILIAGTLKLAAGATVMSVDLGSEWMKVGVVSPGVPMEIALNKESKRKSPSVIAFRNGERMFGEDAQTIGVRFPAKSYKYLLDLLGKTVDNPIVELYKKRFPYFNIVPDPERNTVVFKNDDELYSVEELIAQMLYKAKEFAQDSTGQMVSECVIVVPGFFGQAERAAMLSAAKLANLKVLQLMNDYTAVALNYGIFRRKEMNETAEYFVFYDMGAYKTSAVVVSYQLVKDKATREILPVVQVLGVGYDRTLGGLEMQIRLRDFLGQEFNKMKKTNTDVFTDGRAMAKLFKEAGRLKNILSANTEHWAQIEGLLDEKDFKLHVTRETFENLCTDLFDRVAAPLERALATSGLTMEVVTQVVLFGGNTRVPKVQEILKKSINQELAKNLNADEAACMGAVYRGADLATGFKVKKFITKDAVLLPIQVVFEREGDSGAVRQVKRLLFGQMNSYPQKKVITFNKHNEDFGFDVNYADLELILSENEVKHVGTQNLAKISLTEVNKKIGANTGDNIESKGIKAHFILDDSGVFSLANVELVLEKTVKETEDEGTLSKLGSTISKLFSSGDATEDTNATKSENGTAAENEAAAQNVTEPKVVTVKETIPSEVKIAYVAELEGDKYDQVLARIEAINEAERQRRRRETALNALESFVIDTQVKMDEKEYKSCATKEEIVKIKKKCSEVSEWLYDGDGHEANAITYEKKLNDLERITNEVFSKHWEHNERPEALKALHGMIEGAEAFLKTGKNLTKETNAEKDVFTQNEITNLEKVIQDTIEWRDKEVVEQDKLKRNEPVRLTVNALTEKMAMLDREVKYLVNKIKMWRPKVKPTPPPKTEETNKTGTQEEKPADEDDDGNVEVEAEPEETQEQAPETETSDENVIEPTETVKPPGEGGDVEGEHSEL